MPHKRTKDKIRERADRGQALRLASCKSAAKKESVGSPASQEIKQELKELAAVRHFNLIKEECGQPRLSYWIRRTS